MREQLMRKHLLKDKLFLFKVYSASETKVVKELLAQASITQINTILRYMHLLVTGKIVFSRNDYAAIVQQNKMVRLRRGIESKLSLRNKIKDKSLAIPYLKDMASILGILFKPLFEKHE